MALRATEIAEWRSRAATAGKRRNLPALGVSSALGGTPVRILSAACTRASVGSFMVLAWQFS